MKRLILLIDSSRRERLVVGLRADGEQKVSEEDFDYNKSRGLLVLIKKMLIDSGFELKDLTGIEVDTGPGSFTGLRVGVSVANTLGKILGIPINNLPLGKLVEPTYH